MKTVLFNGDDVLLLFAILQCFLLSAILLFVKNISVVKRCLLSLFLFSMGADFVDTLIYWSEVFKDNVLADQTYVFYVLKFSGFLAAPTLYLYVKSVLFSDFKLSGRSLAHFLPTVFFAMFIMFFVGFHDETFFIAAKYNYEILFHDKAFHVYLLAKNIVYIVYGTCSVRLLANYHKRLKEGFSSIEAIDPVGLRLLVTGFLCIWISYFGSYLSHLLFENMFLADIMGLIGNYLNVFFISTLVVYSLVRSQAFGGVSEIGDSAKDGDDFECKGESSHHANVAILISNAMEQDHLYMDPELTLYQLAEKLSISRKAVSAAINRKFNKNFFEFINDYRLEKAKSILRDPTTTDTMLEVMEKSGFNSKSTFNRCFKRATRMTPSEYHNSEKNPEQ